jgi:hypothetical protein
MIPKQKLLKENKWDTRKFHLWYMEASKRGMSSFNVKIPVEYFHLPGNDLLSLWTSKTCIGCCGKKTLTSSNSPCSLYK